MTLAYFAAWLLAAAGIWLVVNRVPLPAGPAFRDRVLPYLGQPGWRVQPAVEPASDPRRKRVIYGGVAERTINANRSKDAFIVKKAGDADDRI